MATPDYFGVLKSSFTLDVFHLLDVFFIIPQSLIVIRFSWGCLVPVWPSQDAIWPLPHLRKSLLFSYCHSSGAKISTTGRNFSQHSRCRGLVVGLAPYPMAILAGSRMDGAADAPSLLYLISLAYQCGAWCHILLLVETKVRKNQAMLCISY